MFRSLHTNAKFDDFLLVGTTHWLFIIQTEIKLTHPKAKAYNGSSVPSIGSWACNTTGTYVMLFSNPNPHTQTSVYVRAHALDLAAWEDAQSLALLGLVNRRPVAAPAARLVQLSRQREKTEATRPTRYFGI